MLLPEASDAGTYADVDQSFFCVRNSGFREHELVHEPAFR